MSAAGLETRRTTNSHRPGKEYVFSYCPLQFERETVVEPLPGIQAPRSNFKGLIFLPMCKHSPSWLYPTRDQVANKIKFLCAAIGNPFISTVFCEKCGMTGHPIKSRRGGLRWHRNHTAEDKKREFTRAVEFWRAVEVPIPASILQHISA